MVDHGEVWGDALKVVRDAWKLAHDVNWKGLR